MKHALSLSLGLLLLPGAAIAQDSDGDGVLDAFDAFPCDAAAAGRAFAPAEATHGMIVAEDLWPAQGDLDFNDLVLTFHYDYRTDASGAVVALTATFHPVALGGDYDNGLGLRLPVPRGAAASVIRRVGGGVAEPLTASTQDPELTVVLSPNLRELFGGTPGPINSLPSQARRSGSALVVEIRFAAPVPLSVGGAPHDVFLFRSAAPSHEIHRPEHAGTARMNAGLFGSADDGSSINRRFVDRDGLPFVLVFPSAVAYPQEGLAISALYPAVVQFAASAGADARDFYLSPVSSVAFRDSAGLPPLLPAAPSPPAADRSCLPVAGAGQLAAAILADSPSGYWPLDEQSGSVARDASGNGRHGSYVGAVLLGRPGAAGPAADLAGSGWVNTPVSLSQLMPSTQGTVTAVVRIPERLQDFSSLGYPGHIPNAIWTTSAWYQGVTVGRYAGVTGLHLWNFYTGSNDRRVHVQVQRGDWIHLAWVLRGGRLYAYVNGQETSTAAAEAMASMGSFQIGLSNVQSNAFYPSALQHVAAFPVGLSAERIRAHAAAAGLLAPASAPLSCHALLAAHPGAPSGHYFIDSDGGGPAAPHRVFCDMTTDGGGWEVVFVQDPEVDMNATTRGYDLDVARQRANASEALIGYLGPSGQVTGNFARFPMPAEWRSTSPLAAPATDLSVPTVVNGVSQGQRLLRYGTGSFNNLCEHAWGGTWGRICVQGTEAPFFASFASAYADTCSYSHEHFATTFCAAGARRFFIALRAPADLALVASNGDGSTQQLAGESCATIAAHGHSRGAGLYWIDPDGFDSSNAFQAHCLMDTDGGGWTVVYQHHPQSNLNSLGTPYDLVSPVLMQGASEALIGYRTAAGVVTGNVARFALPGDWRARNPLSAPATDVWVDTWVNGSSEGSRLLRYGTGSFSNRCEHGWTGTWGRLCIQSTRAPFFASFATSYADTCVYSDEIYNAATCSGTDRGFFIAVR